MEAAFINLNSVHKIKTYILQWSRSIAGLFLCNGGLIQVCEGCTNPSHKKRGSIKKSVVDKTEYNSGVLEECGQAKRSPLKEDFYLMMSSSGNPPLTVMVTSSKT